MPRITISYRRDDSLDITGRIFDRLAAHFGREAVFRDIDNIPAGANFRRHIDRVLDESDIIIAIVGPRWIGPRAGQSRVSNAADPVRLEIETALRKGKPLIPVLVSRALMPRPDQLPESISEFAYHNAVQVDGGQDFDMHIARLVRAIEWISGSNGVSAPNRAVEGVIAEAPPRIDTSPERDVPHVADAEPMSEQANVAPVTPVMENAPIAEASAKAEISVNLPVAVSADPPRPATRHSVLRWATGLVVIIALLAAGATASWVLIIQPAEIARRETAAAEKGREEDRARQAAAAAEKTREDKQTSQAGAATADTVTPSPAPIPLPADAEHALWQKIEASRNPDDFDEYLKQFPNGRFANEARYQVLILRDLGCDHVGKRGWIGVRIQAVTDEIADNLGLDKARGALVASVTDGGPAQSAGIQPGDVILSFGGMTIGQFKELTCSVADTSPGQVVHVSFWRHRSESGRDVKTGKLALAEPASEPASAPNAPSIADLPIERRDVLPELGLTLSELTPKIRGSLGIPPETSGVLVLAVTEKGSAAGKGLKGGDLILRADQQTVKSTNQLKELAAAHKRAGHKAILLLVERQGDVRFVVLSFNPS